MSKRQSTVWFAENHTLAKIEILRSYLFVWFSVLGLSFSGRDLWYIDGFSGPGEYTNSTEGSPIAALKSARAALDQNDNWQAGKIRCFFIEEDPKRHAHLESLLKAQTLDPRIICSTFQGTFVDGVKFLATQARNPFTAQEPVFSFIDPFGAKGLSFVTVAELLRRPNCELLLNLDSDGINRIYRAGSDANHRELLTDVFGDLSWEPTLDATKVDLPRAIVALYKHRLRSSSAAKYAFAFEMKSGMTSINYHLVFASRHPFGLQKMKEVMKRIDQNGTFSFCSSNVGQHAFRFDDSREAAYQMKGYFAGRSASYAEIHDYALNESPFTNPKAMLKLLEDEGKLLVESGDSKRRKGTYPDRLHSLLRINFAEG